MGENKTDQVTNFEEKVAEIVADSLFNELYNSEENDEEKKEQSKEQLLTLTEDITDAIMAEATHPIFLKRQEMHLLYEYEKHYLDILKDYKEEIKFASSLQEDIRKERAKFFSETLKEVSDTLKEAQVDDNVRSQWVKDLVDSYTKSLDLSSNLAQEHTIETLGKINQDLKQKVNETTEIKKEKN